MHYGNGPLTSFCCFLGFCSLVCCVLLSLYLCVCGDVHAEVREQLFSFQCSGHYKQFYPVSHIAGPCFLILRQNLTELLRLTLNLYPPTHPTQRSRDYRCAWPCGATLFLFFSDISWPRLSSFLSTLIYPTAKLHVPELRGSLGTLLQKL